MTTIIFGVDMEIGSSPNAKRTATYSVYIDLVQPRTLSGITLDKLLELINQYQPSILAIDNYLELTGTSRKLNSLLSKLGNTQLVQVTLKDRSQHTVLRLARYYLGWTSGKPTSYETAKLCTELVKKGIGSIILGYNRRALQVQNLDTRENSSLDTKTLHPLLQQNPYLMKRNIVINFGKGKDAYIYLSEFEENYHVLKYYDPYSPSIGKMNRSYSMARNSNITMAKNEARILDLLSGPFHSPDFIERSGPVVVMDAIGHYEDDIYQISPQLSQCSKESGDAEELLHQAFDLLFTLTQQYHIVHGDFSPQNVLKKLDELYLIDFAQSHEINMNTFTDTPYKVRLDRALIILKQDIKSFCTYFLKRHRITVDEEDIYERFLSVFPNRLLNLCDGNILQYD